MKFSKENYRILEIEENDIKKAKMDVRNKNNLHQIKNEDEFQGQLGELATKFFLNSLKKIHEQKCKENETKTKFTDYKGNKYYEIIKPFFSPNVIIKDNSIEQSKGNYEYKPDNDLLNIFLGDKAKCPIEIKTKKCKNQDWFNLFINEPDMLYSIFSDQSGNIFNQLINKKSEGFTLIWGILYENYKPTKMYCYFLSNYEIRYMLKPEGLEVPRPEIKTPLDELNYIINRAYWGNESLFYPSFKCIEANSISKLKHTKDLIPKKSDLPFQLDFIKYQTEKLWNQEKINMILWKLRSFLYNGQLIYLEEPFYRISLEWIKTECANRIKILYKLNEEEMNSIKEDLSKPFNLRKGLKFDLIEQTKLEQTRERLTSDIRLVYDLQQVFPFDKLNELFINSNE